jgi:hypothetical protein
MRKWTGWAILNSDDSIHRVSMQKPEELQPMVNASHDLGWRWIPVEITELPEVKE